MSKVWNKIRDQRMMEICVNLTLMGWKPVPSSDGKYLYWEKNGSYDHPYGHMMFGACSLFDTPAGMYHFEREVELRRKQIMNEFPGEDVAQVVERQLAQRKKETEERRKMEEDKRKDDEEKYQALSRLKDNCLDNLKRLKGLVVHKTLGTVTFEHCETQLKIYVHYSSWEIGSDEKPIEVNGWRLTCKSGEYEVYSISDPKSSPKFIQELGKYVAERMKV